nr:hypothetical protein [uncultured Oscillibacter sp.]
MNRFNIPLVAEGLTAYAIERQNGWERHQPEGAPPWQAQRRLWIDAILQGMARLEEQVPDPKLMEQFDRELEQAGGSAAAVPASLQLQRGTIQNLRNFVTALEDTGDDRRRQVNVVRELLEDMASHLPWASKDNRLDLARDEAERSLVRMTAQMPIRFTHIALGGDAGPHWASGFVSGSVTDAEAVKQSAVYQGAVRDHPEITNWATLCVVYVGRGLPSALGTVDASDFDLEIMNRTGNRFLDEYGVRWLSGPYQMTIAATLEMAKPEIIPEVTGWMSIQYPFLQGSRALTAEDLDIQELIGAEKNWITFQFDVLADEQEVFGRQLSSKAEDSYIQAYTSYNEHTGQVDDTLDIVVRSPGGDEWFSCTLPDETRQALKQKMDAFCVALYGEHLPEPPAQYRDGPAPIQTGPTM